MTIDEKVHIPPSPSELLLGLVFSGIFVFTPILTTLGIEDYSSKESAIRKHDNITCYRLVKENEESYDPKKDYCQVLDEIFKKQRAGMANRFSLLNKR